MLAPFIALLRTCTGRAGLLLFICLTLPGQTLEPGHSVKARLSGSDSASFAVRMEPGEFIRVTAVTASSSVQATLLDSNSNRVSTTTSLGGTGGTAELAAVSDAGGALRLTVRLTRQDATPREVTVSLTAPEAANIKNRADAEAYRAYSRGLGSKLGTGAIEAFDEATRLASIAGDQWLLSAAAVSKCQTYLQAGEFVKGTDAADAALAAANLQRDKRVEAALVYDSALGHLQHEESRASIALFERAASLARELDQQYELSSSLHNLSVARWLLGDCTAALTGADEALAIRRELHDRAREAYSLMAIAKDYFCLGDAQHSLDTYAEVAPLWTELKDQANQAAVLNDRGLLYSYLGDSGQAAAAHQEALTIRAKIGDKSGLVESLVNLGQLKISLDQYKEAQSYCERALALAREIHYQRGQAYALLNLAEALMMDNGKRQRPKAATGTAREARRMLLAAISTFDEEGHRPGAAWAWRTLGKLDRSTGDLTAAGDDFAKALTIEQEVGDRNLECVTLVDLARLSCDRHDNAAGLSYADRAIALVEQSRASLMAPDLRAAWLSSKREAYGLRIFLLHQKQAAAAALATSEQAHARVLLDALAESPAREGRLQGGLDPHMHAELDRIDAELNARADSLARASGSNKEAAELRRSIDRLLSEKQEMEVRIRETNPRYASLVLPSPARLDEIRRYALDDNSVLLEYFVADEESYLLAVTNHSLDMFKVAGRATLEPALRRLYEGLTERNRLPTAETPARRVARLQQGDASVASASKTLSAMLVGPIRHLLKHRVIVVADGPLHMVPFSLLFPAAADHEIVLLPSASVLVEMRKDQLQRSRQTLPALVIADPVFSADDERLATTANRPADARRSARLDLPRLQSSRKEAENIASLAPPGQVSSLVDFAANADALRHGDLSSYRVIHIASHALLDLEHPALSGIVLSTVDRSGTPRDGEIRLHEIYDLSLATRLVVLSACRTAIGKDMSGEGMIGLSRGFLYAGAQSVVATLWSVDDRATTRFMSRFYSALWKEGRSPAEALQVARQWMMRQPGFASPYYWAGYTLTGDWH